MILSALIIVAIVDRKVDFKFYNQPKTIAEQIRGPRVPLHLSEAENRVKCALSVSFYLKNPTAIVINSQSGVVQVKIVPFFLLLFDSC